MANPFTSFAYPATGAPTPPCSPNSCNRTTPDRIADIKNVKEFGAKGDGVTDDWAAIMSAYNWTTNGLRGIIFFPAGTYLVSQPINYGASYSITSGTYDSTSGTVVLTMANDLTPFLFVGSILSLLNFTGTGAFASLEGQQTVTAVSPTTVTYVATSGLGASSITGGLLITDTNVDVYFKGVLGLSTITGNFADYIFSRSRKDTSGESGGHTIENLAITNTNAAGGGIRIGACEGAAVRNCNVTANLGINTASYDGTDIGGVTSQEVAIENCTLNAFTSNASGSVGIMTVSDGPIANCTVVGFATGYTCWGQQPGSNLWGCHFESCATGLLFGFTPEGVFNPITETTVSACTFKNCGTAISVAGGGFHHICGVKIEGVQGGAPGSTNPQYGINIGSGVGGNCLYQGVTVNGYFDVAGIAIAGGDSTPDDTVFMGVQVTNTKGGGTTWSMPSTANTALYFGTNAVPVFTVSQLPAGANSFEGDSYNVSDGTNSLAWGATLTNTGTHTTHYKTRYNGSNFTVVGQ